MFSKALLPVTLCENEANLTSYMTLMSGLGTRDIHMCHVIDSGFSNHEQLSNTISDFEHWIHDHFPRIHVSSEIKSGHAASELLASANNFEVNYIYIPASRRNRFGKFLIGSTAADLVRLTNRPVFVHKDRPEIINNKGSKIFRELIVSVDLGPNTERVTSTMYGVGSLADKIKYLHIGKRGGDPFSEKKRQDRVHTGLKKLQDKYECSCRETEIKDKIGIPSKEIIKETKQDNTDLVIMGKVAAKKPATSILGSTAERVLKGTQASLLIVP